MASNRRGRKRTRTVNNNIELTTEEKRAKKIKVHHRSHGDVQGQVLAVGAGDTGQLGLGPDVMERTFPGKVDLPAEVLQVCAGGMHSVCVTTKGHVYTWGCNDEGALGRKTEDEDDTMIVGKVEISAKIVQVSAGDSHTAALSDDGCVFAWGIFRDANGKIGLDPSGETVHTPMEILKGRVVIKISSGADHLVALTDGGDIFTVGCAEQGQLGRVAECFSQRGGRKGLDLLLNPSKVYFKKRSLKCKDIWTGQYVTFAQAQDTDAIYAWGLNNYYQLGLVDMENRFVPELVMSFDADKEWQELSGGQHHTLALDKQGQVYSLGRTEYGRLGLGQNVTEKKVPTPVTSLKGKKCIAVSSGSAVSFTVTDKGEIFAWGMGTNKQLGQKEEDDIWEPVLMAGKQLQERKGLMVSAGGQHTVILAKDNS